MPVSSARDAGHDPDTPIIRDARLPQVMTILGDAANRRRLRLELRRGDIVVGSRELTEGAPDAEGRRALNRLLPVMAAHPAVFDGHVLLVSFAGVLRAFPDRGEAALRRIGARLVPRLKAAAGAGASCVWISPIHLLVFGPSDRREGLLDCPAVCQDEMHVLLGDTGRSALEHYLLDGIHDMRLDFVQMRPGQVDETSAAGEGSTGDEAAWRTFRPAPPALVPGGHGVPETVRPVLPEAHPVGASGADLPRVGTVYKPIWDLRNEVVTASLALPARILHGHLALGADAVPEAYEDGNILTEVLAILLESVGRDLVALYGKGGAGFVSVGIPFDAVSNSRRLGRIAVAAGAMPAAARKGLLLALTDIPADVGDGKVLDILRMLRPVSRGLMLTVEPREAQWRRFLDQRLAAIGIEAPDDGRLGEDLGGVATRFAADCHARRRRCYFGPVTAHDQVATLRTARIDYVYGSPVAPARVAPVPACTYPRSDFEAGHLLR